jgi:hypothetical protein
MIEEVRASVKAITAVRPRTYPIAMNPLHTKRQSGFAVYSAGP